MKTLALKTPKKPFIRTPLSFISLSTLIFCLFISFEAFAVGKKPFVQNIEIQDGFILLQASVNGQVGTFILDSGTPGLVLNSQIFTEGKSDPNQLIGLGGQVKTTIYKQAKFKLNQFKLNVPQAYAIDLQYMQDAIGGPVYGFIGLDLFEGYTVKIDYAALLMECSISAIELTSSDYIEVPIQRHGHLNVLKLELGKKKLNMILDTGSESNLISTNWKNRLGLVTQKSDLVELVGADQKIQKSHKLRIKGLHLGSQSMAEHTFLYTSFEHYEQQLDFKIDGILGQAFLKHYVVVLSRNRKKLRLYKVPNVDVTSL